MASIPGKIELWEVESGKVKPGKVESWEA